MKKSKIIIPALGMLLLSTAASVSGTVAWFTSMQTATSDITSFAVTKTGGSMATALTAGAGTVVSGSAITLQENVKLTHGSFNHTSNTAFYPNDTATVFTGVAKPDGSSTAFTTWALPGTDNKVYFAVSWTITFTYTFSGSTAPVYLYFDGTAGEGATSKMTAHTQTEAGTNSDLQSYKGFRVALMATSKVIWAPEQSNAADLKYQSAANATTSYGANGEYAASGSLISSAGYAANKTDAIGNTPTSRADYLGTFATPTAPATTSQIVVNCVAWFEGNDSNIVNAAYLHNVSATLGFYTRASA